MASKSQAKLVSVVRGALLKDAINDASVGLLKKTLMQLCDELPAAEEAVAKKLLTVESSVRKDGDSSDESESELSDSESDLSSDSDAAPKPKKPSTPKKEKAGAKRMRSRYTFCENCNEEYDVVYNFSDSCLYHPGRCPWLPKHVFIWFFWLELTRGVR